MQLTNIWRIESSPIGFPSSWTSISGCLPPQKLGKSSNPRWHVHSRTGKHRAGRCTAIALGGRSVIPADPWGGENSRKGVNNKNGYWQSRIDRGHQPYGRPGVSCFVLCEHARTPTRPRGRRGIGRGVSDRSSDYKRRIARLGDPVGCGARKRDVTRTEATEFTRPALIDGLITAAEPNMPRIQAMCLYQECPSIQSRRRKLSSMGPHLGALRCTTVVSLSLPVHGISNI